LARFNNIDIACPEQLHKECDDGLCLLFVLSESSLIMYALVRSIVISCMYHNSHA